MTDDIVDPDKVVRKCPIPTGRPRRRTIEAKNRAKTSYWDRLAADVENPRSESAQARTTKLMNILGQGRFAELPVWVARRFEKARAQQETAKVARASSQGGGSSRGDRESTAVSHRPGHSSQGGQSSQGHRPKSGTKQGEDAPGAWSGHTWQGWQGMTASWSSSKRGRSPRTQGWQSGRPSWSSPKRSKSPWTDSRAAQASWQGRS